MCCVPLCRFDANLCPYAHDITLMCNRTDAWRRKPCRHYNGHSAVCEAGRECTYAHRDGDRAAMSLAERTCGPSLFRVIEAVARSSGVADGDLVEFIATSPALRAPLVK